MDTNKDISLFELQIDHESTIYLREAAKWAKFLAVLGFIWSGVLAIMGFFRLVSRVSYSYNTNGYEMGTSIAYITIAVVCFFPCINMFNFSRKAQWALQSNDQNQLNGALKNLKSGFRILGITSIVWLCLILLAFIFFALL